MPGSAAGTDELDAEAGALVVVGRLPLAAGQLEDVVRHHHGERRALLQIPLPDAFAPQREGRIEDMHRDVVALALHAIEKIHARGLLDQPQFQDDPAAAIEKPLAVAPDEIDQPVLALDVPRDDVLPGPIRAEQRRKPFVEGDMDGVTAPGQRLRVGGLARANAAFYQVQWCEGHGGNG